MAENITVPYVPFDEFHWSISHVGPLPWNQTVWYYTSLSLYQRQFLTFVLA
jgi:hypothetical protein